MRPRLRLVFMLAALCVSVGPARADCGNKQQVVLTPDHPDLPSELVFEGTICPEPDREFRVTFKTSLRGLGYSGYARVWYVVRDGEVVEHSVDETSGVPPSIAQALDAQIDLDDLLKIEGLRDAHRIGVVLKLVQMPNDPPPMHVRNDCAFPGHHPTMTLYLCADQFDDEQDYAAIKRYLYHALGGVPHRYGRYLEQHPGGSGRVEIIRFRGENSLLTKVVDDTLGDEELVREISTSLRVLTEAELPVVWAVSLEPAGFEPSALINPGWR